MAAPIKSSSSSSGSLSPSPAGSVTSMTMAAPPPPPPPSQQLLQLPTSARQRKKPGPKPKAAATTAAKLIQTLVVKLKIKQEVLATLKTFSTEPAPTATATPTGSSPPSAASPQPSTDAPAEALLASGQKRKGVPGPKPGAKRVRQPGVPPLKPGRKKTKLDPSLPAGLLNATTHGGKLGPKANTGAINDKLRALDRTGKPCKRWSKAGFTLKSFTGVQWTVPTWAAPKSQSIAGGDAAATSASENASVTNEPSPDDKMQTDMPVPIIPTLSLPPLGITV